MKISRVYLLIVSAILFTQIAIAGDFREPWTVSKIAREAFNVSCDFVRTLSPFSAPIAISAAVTALPSASAWCSCSWHDLYKSCQNELNTCNDQVAAIKQIGTDLCNADAGCRDDIADSTRIADALHTIAPNSTFSPEQVNQLANIFDQYLQTGNCSVTTATCNSGVFAPNPPVVSESSSVVAPATAAVLFGLVAWKLIEDPQILPGTVKAGYNMLSCLAEVFKLEEPNEDDRN